MSNEKEYGISLTVDGEGDVASANRLIAEVLLAESKIDLGATLKIEGLWFKAGRGATVKANGRVFLIRLGPGQEDTDKPAGAPAEGGRVADEKTEQRPPGERIYLALEAIMKGCNATPPESAGDLHAAVMPIVREYDDGLAKAWQLVNDGAPKGEILAALEANLPAFRVEELPTRQN